MMSGLKNLYVVATEEEKYRLVPMQYWKKCVVTGVGFANVFRALEKISRETIITNIGFAGSNKLSIGTFCRISKSINYHPNCSFQPDPVYKTKDYVNNTQFRIEKKSFPCYTSGDFVLKTNITEPVVFDMELYAIFAMGFKKVSAAKFITDNLSVREYFKSTLQEV